MIDFSISIYKKLLQYLAKNYESFLPMEDLFSNKKLLDVVIIRHDIDRLPKNSLKLAEIENSFGIRGSYYLRVVPESFNIKIINKIKSLGHEIGYHYEDVDLVMKSKKLKIKNEKDRENLIDLAYVSFCDNLDKFKGITDLKTICMHGSPLSRFDNKIIWEKYSYKKLGLIAEPYFDINWNEFAYLTDTGRRWNGNEYSIRDKVNTPFNFNYKTTYDIIDNIERLPNKIMITIHPERWTNNPVLWSNQYVMQNLKNFN